MVERGVVRVEGFVAPGWERVADTFGRAFAQGRETGSAVAVYHEGVVVVDLWGGLADSVSGAAWQQDTVVPVFSTSKGVTAVCAHLLAQRGQLDLDLPVATYWPEFAAAGKATCTVGQLLAHQAGLHVVDRDLTFEDLRAVEPIVRALERQPPRWVPGTHVAYHAITFGHLVGELVHRVTGKTLGAFLRDEVVAPLELQMWLGLPTNLPVQVARLEMEQAKPGLPGRLLGGLLSRSLTGEYARSATRAITLSGALPDPFVTGEPGDLNDRATLAVELGAVNLVTNARSLARFYAATVSDVDGIRLLDDETLADITVYRGGVPYWGMPRLLGKAILTRFPMGLGFCVPCRLGPTTFGHWGAGGSLAVADVASRVGFSYVMNRMESDANARSKPLLDAVKACVNETSTR
jgi:CubicO group peptidase (beta-lactamase class C family)